MNDKLAIYALQKESKLAALVFVIGLILYIYKTYLEGSVNQRKVKNETVALLQNALSMDMSKANGTQRLIIEQAFQAAFGKLIGFNVIEALLRCSNPSMAIKLYIKGSLFLKYCEDSKSIILKKSYKHFSLFSKHIYYSTLIFLLLYIVFAFPGLWLLFNVHGLLINHNYFIGIMFFVFGSFLCYLAYFFLLESTNINEAVTFVEKYR